MCSSLLAFQYLSLFELDFSQRYLHGQCIDNPLHILFKSRRDRKPYNHPLRLHGRKSRHPFVRFKNELEVDQIMAINLEEMYNRLKECLKITIVVWQLSPPSPP